MGFEVELLDQVVSVPEAAISFPVDEQDRRGENKAKAYAAQDIEDMCRASLLHPCVDKEGETVIDKILHHRRHDEDLIPHLSEGIEDVGRRRDEDRATAEEEHTVHRGCGKVTLARPSDVSKNDGADAGSEADDHDQQSIFGLVDAFVAHRCPFVNFVATLFVLAQIFVYPPYNMTPAGVGYFNTGAVTT